MSVGYFVHSSCTERRHRGFFFTSSTSDSVSFLTHNASFHLHHMAQGVSTLHTGLLPGAALAIYARGL